MFISKAGRETRNAERGVVRVAKFATTLWRTINGEFTRNTLLENIDRTGVCAHDGHLRCTLLSLWQRIWPSGCFAVLRAQTWKQHEGTQKFKELGVDLVMFTSDEDKEAASFEDEMCGELKRIVATEIDRQKWRGEMAARAYEYSKKDDKIMKDPTGAASQGLGIPLPPIKKDNAWKLGGWTASTAQQRRAKGADGGTAVTKIRLTVKSGGD